MKVTGDIVQLGIEGKITKLNITGDIAQLVVNGVIVQGGFEFTDLITSITNEDDSPYNTFVSSGDDITSAIYTVVGSGYASAESNRFTASAGLSIRLTVTLTLNSGEAPYFGVFSDPYSFDQSVRLVNGVNVFDVTFPTSGNYYMSISNNLATNYSLVMVQTQI